MRTPSKKNMDGKLPDPYLDTNIIVRLLTGDDLAKQAASAKLFKEVAQGKVMISSTDAIIAETVFVLSSPNLYHLPKTEIRDSLSLLLKFANFRLDNKQAIIADLDIYASYNIHFVDSLLLALTRQSEEKALYSYDEGFDKFPDIVRKV